MPDTLFNKIDSLNLRIDSLSQRFDSKVQILSDSINSKFDSIHSNIDNLTPNSSPSLAGPIFAALITAVLGSLLAQGIDRYFKNKRETTRDLREIHSKSVNLKIKLKDLFRQLAMHKFHAQYWYVTHIKQPDSEYKEKCYLEHLRSQSEARATEKAIGETKAEFLSEVVKYEKLRGSAFNVDKEKQIIENLLFDKAKAYSDETDLDILRHQEAEKDEAELREKYFAKLEAFQNIINSMT